MRITGTVVHESLEGGFWGIVGDDGQQYKPVDDLPPEVRTDGCRVAATVEPVQIFSFAMWGQNVRVSDVETL